MKELHNSHEAQPEECLKSMQVANDMIEEAFMAKLGERIQNVEIDKIIKPSTAKQCLATFQGVANNLNLMCDQRLDEEFAEGEVVAGE